VATVAWFEADSVCGSHSAAIPLVLVLPYLFRLFQCIRQYKDSKDIANIYNGNNPKSKRFFCVWLSARFLTSLPCLCFSAGKYLTAVPVIFLSALKYYIDPDTWTYSIQPAWILSGLANTFFSFFWDILRDWDLRYCECKTDYSNLGFSVIFRFLTSLLLVVSSLGFSNSPDQIFSPIYYMDAVG